MNGILNCYKPVGMTSFDMVAAIRKNLKVKKVGHTGTLDPMASGVLVLCIGKATRISQYIMDSEKEYIAELTLGYATDTQDMEGRVLNHSTKKVSEKEIYKVFDNFKGEIEQIPPMYSAIKHKGKRLYELARKGKTVERKARKVNIYNIDIIRIEENKKIIFKVKCSPGTYIRTLCNDIGEKLGTYGYMSYLTRTSVGDFKLEDSISLREITDKNIKESKDLILAIDAGLKDLPAITVADKYYKRAINGAMVEIESTMRFNSTDILRVYNRDKFLGLGKILKKNDTNFLRMTRVLV